MGARQSNTKSEALITSGEALQLCVDPLSPAFLANTVMRSLILGGGTPTASMKRALGWLKHDRQARGADPATSRLLNFPGLEARPPPEKIKYEEEELVVIEAALRMECWPNPPPRGIKMGKVERRGGQRVLSIPWTFFKTGHWRGVDPAKLKLEVLAAAALGFLGGEEGDVKALVMFERTTPKASANRYGALHVGSRLALLEEQFQEEGSGRIGTIKSWSRHSRKFVCLFDDGSEKELGVSALFGIIVKSRSLEGGVVLCGKTEVDVLNWYKREVRWRRSGKPPPKPAAAASSKPPPKPAAAALSFEPVSAAAISASAAAFDYGRKVHGREALPRRSVEKESAASARATAASLLEVGTSLEKKIDEAITADPEMQARAEMKLSDARLHASELGTWVTGSINGANWNIAQGRHMEAEGVITVRNLALVNVNNTELALTLTSGEDTATGRKTARRKLWNWKGAAAALVGVDDIGELPKLTSGRKPKDVAEPKEKKQRR